VERLTTEGKLGPGDVRFVGRPPEGKHSLPRKSDWTVEGIKGGGGHGKAEEAGDDGAHRKRRETANGKARTHHPTEISRAGRGPLDGGCAGD
jgi:hypothetical protein